MGGPRAQALGEGERPETGGDATDGRADVARVTVPENLGGGSCQGRGDPPTGLEMTTGLLSHDDRGAVEGSQEHGG